MSKTIEWPTIHHSQIENRKAIERSQRSRAQMEMVNVARRSDEDITAAFGTGNSIMLALDTAFLEGKAAAQRRARYFHAVAVFLLMAAFVIAALAVVLHDDPSISALLAVSVYPVLLIAVNFVIQGLRISEGKRGIKGYRQVFEQQSAERVQSLVGLSSESIYRSSLQNEWTRVDRWPIKDITNINLQEERLGTTLVITLGDGETTIQFANLDQNDAELALKTIQDNRQRDPGAINAIQPKGVAPEVVIA